MIVRAAIMPTLPTAARTETAARVAARILPQVDVLHVHFNGHQELPTWSRDRRVVAHRHPVGTGPAVRLSVVPNADVVLLLDDDMNYPPDYVARSVAHLQRLGLGTAISFHASFWRPKAEPRFQKRELIMYTASRQSDVPVTMISMLTASFHAQDFRRHDRVVPPLFEREDDVWVSAACARAGIRLIRPPSAKDWITHTPAAEDGLFSRAQADRFVKRDAAIKAALALGSWRLTP